MEFENFNLDMSLLRGIYSHGFETPSDIQSKSIPIILSGKDLLAQSQSGTGKTGSFVISALQHIKNIPEVQVIVVSPTREIATQSYNIFREIGHYMPYNYELLIGGMQHKKQTEKKPTIAVCTLGRILDLIKRNIISTKFVSLLIIDEADELLSNNFEEQLAALIKNINKNCQIAMFSATLSKEIIVLSKKIMRDPEIIKLEQDNVSLDGITQYCVNCEKEEYKYETLIDLFNKKLRGQTIIFVNYKKYAEVLKLKLEKEKYVVSFIHSDLDQNLRNNILKDFKQNKSNILISTDLLSRGIDIYGIEMVINYDLPTNKEAYIHRIGRTGRYGRKGIAINLICDNEAWKIEELEVYYSMNIIPITDFDNL